MEFDIDPNVICECANCSWRGTADKLNPIADFWERVAPGDICPAGECPKCGACAHVVREPEAAFDVAAAWDSANAEARMHVLKSCGIWGELMVARSVALPWCDIWPKIQTAIEECPTVHVLVSWPCIEDARPTPETTLA